MQIRLLYLFICISVSVAAQSPFTKIRENKNEKDFTKSLQLVDSCLSKNYQKDSALFYKSWILLKQNNLKEAKKNCAALIKTFPDFKEAHYLSGLIYFSDYNYGKCIDEFNLVLKANPNHLKALYNRSIAFGMLEDYLYAIEDLNTCVSINPAYSIAYYSRAYWYEYTGNYTEAIKDYLTTIKLDPQNYDAYLGLAFVYLNQKETSKACETINSAILAGSQIAEDVKDSFCH